jgi:hypothetical protein
MSNFFKVRKHLRSIMIALDNFEYGRMPLEYFEDVFEARVETIRGLIEAERRIKSDEATKS